MAFIKSKNTDENYGVIGNPTGCKNLYIGDIVAFNLNGRKDILHGVVIKYGNDIRVMGVASTPIKSLVNLVKVLDSKYIDNRMLCEFHSHLHIVEPKKMTLEEIEIALGYEIEIV